MTAQLFLVHQDRAIPLSRGALAIGRLDECQLVLEGREVSRRHARIVATPRGPLLVDRSRFGTEVNGARVAARRCCAMGTGCAWAPTSCP